MTMSSTLMAFSLAGGTGGMDLGAWREGHMSFRASITGGDCTGDSSSCDNLVRILSVTP